MEQLTQMELLQIEELLRSEVQAAKFSQVAAEAVGDETLAGLCREAANLHRTHYEELLQMVQRLHGRP